MDRFETGWWYTYPSEKYDFVSWDDDIPNIWKNKKHVPNHQPGEKTQQHGNIFDMSIFYLFLPTPGSLYLYSKELGSIV